LLLISPFGAIVNGLEVLEEAKDEDTKTFALDLIRKSANTASAKLQFCRIAFGAAGSAGAELDLSEIGRLVTGLLAGGKTSLAWDVGAAYWPKDWAKLLMNATLLAADCLPRGGTVRVTIGPDPAAPRFHIEARGTHVRVAEDVERMLRGESTLSAVDARGVQPFLTHKLSRTVNAGLLLRQGDGMVEVTAG
jgi:histidine phosphotransferase ChpT